MIEDASDLRWYQSEAVDAVMTSLQDRDCHPIVVAPTGSGKTVMIAELINAYLSKHPQHHILVLSHVKEILNQDYQALTSYFRGITVGLYSAGLDSRTIEKITVASIQSVYQNQDRFYHFDVVIIDECHLVTDDDAGMYRTFLAQLNANFIGFTATHFRLSSGYLHEGDGALFNHIAYDLSSPDKFNKLVDEGHLTQLVTKDTALKMRPDEYNKSRGGNFSFNRRETRNPFERIKTRAGDYDTDDLARVYGTKTVTDQAIKEIVEIGQHYRKWLLFTIDIQHAQRVTSSLISRKVNAGIVHSRMSDHDRDAVISSFRDGSIKAIVNVNILTTGLDVPDIDLIAILRPTKSPVLHVQLIGRGLRVAANKDHCLILDFAGNTHRLGPINDIHIKRKKTKSGKEVFVIEAPEQKLCPKCSVLLPSHARICNVCGFVFNTELKGKAGITPVVRKPGKVEWHFVNDVRYNLHKKQGKPHSLRVTYRIGLTEITDFICLEHGGYAGRRAETWVRHRAPDGMPMPKDTMQLFEWSPWLKKPIQLLVDFGGRFANVKEARFNDAWGQAITNTPKSENQAS